MIFFDAYAIIELINGNPKYEKYKNTTIITNTLHLSEVFYSLLKKINEKQTTTIINSLNFVFVEINKDIACESAIFKSKNKRKKMSYADCIGYITAKYNNMLFLTGDKEFKNFTNVEFIKK